MPGGYSIDGTSGIQAEWLKKYGPSTKINFTPNYNFNLNNNSNWGVTDGFQKSNSTENNAGSAVAKVENTAKAGQTIASIIDESSSSETDEEIKTGTEALSSDDVDIVTSARDGVAGIESNPDSSAQVQSASAQVDKAKEGVTTATDDYNTALSLQKDAQKAEETAQKEKDKASEEVTQQKQVVSQNKTRLQKAEADVIAAEGQVSAAQASVASATSALAAAQAAIPFSAAAVAAAESALAAAKAQLAEAQAELSRAQTEKQAATTALQESEQKLAKDEDNLKIAEKNLSQAQKDTEKATEDVNQAKEKLASAKSELSEKQANYEAIKTQTQQQASELKTKLNEKLEELEKGKDSGSSSDKLKSISNLGQQGFNGLSNLFSQAGKSQASSDASSTKRPMTAEEKARIYAFTDNLARSLNNGFGQITTTGQMVSDFTTSSNTNASNPFIKKEIV